MDFNNVIPTEKRINVCSMKTHGGQPDKSRRYIGTCQSDYILTYFIQMSKKRI